MLPKIQTPCNRRTRGPVCRRELETGNSNIKHNRIHMHRLTGSLLALAAAGVSLAAPPDLTKLPPAASQKGVTYAKDIRPLFEASCFRCHGEQQQKGKLRLDSLEAVMKGSEDGKILVAGKSKESPLVIAVSQLDEEKAMPPKFKGGPGRGPGGPGGPGGHGGPGGQPGAGGPPPGGPGGPGGRPGGFGPPPKPLTAEQVGLVRAWIDQGAK